MNLKSGAFIGAVYLFSLLGTTAVNAEEYPKKADKTTTGGTDNNTAVQNKLAGTNGLLAGCSEPNEKNRSEEHTSELQSRRNLVCRLLLEKKKK